jgi:hypothetical protein
MNRYHRTGRAAVGPAAVLAVAGLLIAGCSSDSPGSLGSSTTTNTIKAVEPVSGGGLVTMTEVLDKAAFGGGPQTVEELKSFTK